MKHNAQQLALFTGMALTDAIDTRGASTVTRYKKAGKKWDGEVDDEGFILVDGEKVESARVLTFLPTKSKTKDDMADATGLTGKELKQHNLVLRSSMLTEALALVARKERTGQYKLSNNGLVQRANGKITLTMEPANATVVRATMTEEEFAKLAAEKGYVLAPAPKTEAKSKGSK